MGNILHNRGASDERAGRDESNERPDVLVHVADNVRRLRQAAALSQQALAERAGISRRMLVNIENRSVNVSLNTLDRIAEALGVLFHVLVQPPDSPDSACINEIAWAGRQSESHATLLASKPARHEVELWAWSLAPGERYDSPPNGAGWYEMVLVIEGQLTLHLSDEVSLIEAGGFRVFPSDQAYGYANATERPLRFMRNVVY